MPVRILDPQCVGKTFPDYFETLFGVRRAPAPQDVPVITVDGPTASGKGTLASAVAKALGYHFLDSGARLPRHRAGRDARQRRAPTTNSALAQLAANLDLHFDADTICLGGQDVTEPLRAEEVGALRLAGLGLAAVRAALRALQVSFRRMPGLVADGRDMGTVIFPDAELKVFLTASAATRAERRYKQLISKGISANIDSLRAELEARDARDQTRSVSPLKPAVGCDAAGQLGTLRRSLGGSGAESLGTTQAVRLQPERPRRSRKQGPSLSLLCQSIRRHAEGGGCST